MIAVIGCGRVGLPLAVLLASRDQNVLGVDTDPAVVQALRGGRMPFPDEFAEPLLHRARGRTFHVTEDLRQAVKTCDTFIITVGTPLSEDMLPDQGALGRTIAAILAGRREPGTEDGPVVILRSTVLPGTTEGLVRMIGRRFDVFPGQGYRLAFCPERTLEGASRELLELPQVIGVADPASEKAALSLFGLLGVDLVVTGLVEAELAKLCNNAYRYVNFALANEFMCLARGLGASAKEVLRAANHGYPRGGIPRPGYAAGPCLFKDGFFLNQRLGMVDLVLASWKMNESLPEFFIQEVERVRPIRHPVVLGVSFKADSDDIRNSLGLKLIRLLEIRGHRVSAHDPHVGAPGLLSDLSEALSGAGEVFVTVPHREYRELPWDTLCGLAADDCVVADPWLTWDQPDVVHRL